MGIMKIVYCIDSLHNPGGMERVLTTKANYLAEEYDYDVHIALRYEDEAPFFALSPKVICHPLQARTNKEHRQSLEKLLNDLRPDITISMCGAEFSFLYRIHDGSKKIAEFHFTKYYLTYLVNGILHLPLRPLHRLKAWLIQKREERNATKYDKVVLLTEQDYHIWGEPKNMCYIHNPLSFRSNTVSPLTTKRIVAVGRLIAQKGFFYLIQAFSLVAKEFPDWQLSIYGEGQDYEMLNNMITANELERQVHILPSSKNIENVLITSSFFVFPSIYEGFGLVITEAMECGLPCIAFDCECGPKEIIRDGDTGFLVKSKDFYGLANKMRVLMQNGNLRTNMGQKAKNSVSSFYPENIMPQWNNLFNELTQQNT